jgi:hypothetical protein
VLRALASSRAGNVLADRQRAADKARLVADVADAKRRLAAASVANGELKARNRKAGAPADSTTAALDSSSSAVMTAEVLADMIKSDEDAYKMGGRLVEAVTATETAVEKARRALAEREARDEARANAALVAKVREASATLKTLPGRLEPLHAAMRRARGPPLEVTNAIDEASGAVSGAESGRAALYALPDMRAALAAASDADGGGDGDGDGSSLVAAPIKLTPATTGRINEFLLVRARPHSCPLAAVLLLQGMHVANPRARAPCYADRAARGQGS